MARILLEYSEIIRLMSQFPNGEKLAKLAHRHHGSGGLQAPGRLVADAQWEKVNNIKKFSIASIKRRAKPTYVFFANEKNSVYMIASQHGCMLYSIAKDDKVTEIHLNRNDFNIEKLMSAVNRLLVGDPTHIYYDKQSGFAASEKGVSRTSATQTITNIYLYDTFVNIILNKIKPLLKLYFQKTIAEIRGDIMIKIKSGAVTKAEDRLNKLNKLIRAYEEISMLENGNNKEVKDLIWYIIYDALIITAKKYYPDLEHGNIAGVGSASQGYYLTTPLKPAEKELVDNISMEILGTQQLSQDSASLKQKRQLAKQQFSVFLYVLKKLLLKL